MIDPVMLAELQDFRAEGARLRERAIERGDLKLAGEFAEGIAAIDRFVEDPSSERAAGALGVFILLVSL